MVRSRSEAALRRYQPGDGPAVEALHRRALQEAGTDPDDVPDNGDLRVIGRAYLDSGGEFLVAESEGRIVACGGLLRDGSTAELKRIAVDPDYQREGFGTVIVDGLERAARDRSCDRIVLTTASRQTSATDFYPERGYERLGTERVNGYDLIEFGKRL